MKKIVLSLFILIVSLNCFCQTCEEREPRIQQAMVGFSSALLYNTYGVIGSIADAYVKNAYNAEMVDQLMNAQKNLADNLVKVLDGLVKDNILVTQMDKDYAVSAINILEGLKKQGGLLQEYAQTNSRQKQEAYDDQRKKNWSVLSKLMGIKE